MILRMQRCINDQQHWPAANMKDAEFIGFSVSVLEMETFIQTERGVSFLQVHKHGTGLAFYRTKIRIA